MTEITAESKMKSVLELWGGRNLWQFVVPFSDKATNKIHIWSSWRFKCQNNCSALEFHVRAITGSVCVFGNKSQCCCQMAELVFERFV